VHLQVRVGEFSFLKRPIGGMILINEADGRL